MLDVVHLHQEAEPGGDTAEERRPFGQSGGHIVLVDLEGTQELPEHRGEVDHSVPPVVRQVDVELAVGVELVQLAPDGLGDELRLADPADPDHQHDARLGPAARDRPASRRSASSFVRLTNTRLGMGPWRGGTSGGGVGNRRPSMCCAIRTGPTMTASPDTVLYAALCAVPPPSVPRLLKPVSFHRCDPLARSRG